MAAGASVALLGGVEGLIGAFLAGLGMNALIPTRSVLMERIEFVGGAIFVPAFLVSIGLSIDPRAMFDVDTIALALAFTALVVGERRWRRSSRVGSSSLGQWISA
jgi:Kef-type K+ transport system membrane component KefB